MIRTASQVYNDENSTPKRVKILVPETPEKHPQEQSNIVPETPEPLQKQSKMVPGTPPELLKKQSNRIQMSSNKILQELTPNVNKVSSSAGPARQAPIARPQLHQDSPNNSTQPVTYSPQDTSQTKEINQLYHILSEQQKTIKTLLSTNNSLTCEAKEMYFATEALLHQHKQEYALERHQLYLAIDAGIENFQHSKDDNVVGIGERIAECTRKLKVSCENQYKNTDSKKDKNAAKSCADIADNIKVVADEFDIENQNENIKQYVKDCNIIAADLYANYDFSDEEQTEDYWQKRYDYLIAAFFRNPEKYSEHYLDTAITKMSRESNFDPNIYYKHILDFNVRLVSHYQKSTDYTPEKKRELYQKIRSELLSLQQLTNVPGIISCEKLSKSIDDWINVLYSLSQPKDMSYKQILDKWKNFTRNIPVNPKKYDDADVVDDDDDLSSSSRYHVTGSFK